MAKIESIEKKEEIYNYIKEQILRHKILPGEKIPEQDIAKALGIPLYKLFEFKENDSVFFKC